MLHVYNMITGTYTKPIKVVAVLGIGHVNGVVANWDKDLEGKAQEVMKIPQPSIVGRLLGVAIKGAIVAGGVYATYRIGKVSYNLVNKLLSKYVK